MGSGTAGTVHDGALRHAADTMCEADPQVGTLVLRTLRWMRKGVYPAHILDSIVQKSRGSYDNYDAYALWKFDVEFFGGNIAFAEVPVGAAPSRDADAAANQAKLDRITPPFRAEFYGGHGDEDGFLTWDGDAEFFACREWGETEPRMLACGRRTIPLEVGTTSASRSMMHLVEDKSLARWPYGHESCYVFIYLL